MDVAADGHQGWQMADSCDYDLIILDLMLPGLSGGELLRRIRRKNHQVPILILTARDATEEKVANFEAGADDYLTKPFAFAELRHAGEGAVAPRAGRALERAAGRRSGARPLHAAGQARRQAGSSSRPRNTRCSNTWPPIPDGYSRAP